MTDPLARLQAVHTDIAEALARTSDILRFVTDQKAPPDIRVAISNNLIVSLVSIIEEGIRSLFGEYLRIVEENVGSYRRIRTELAEANLRGAATLLNKSIETSSGIDAAAITKSLLQCLNDESGFRLATEEITYNRNNLRSREVSELAKRLGIRDVWKLICSQPPAKAMFPDQNEEQIQTLAVQRWNALFDERNTIVHRISQAAGWGDTIILPYIVFLGTIAECLAVCLAEDAKLFLHPFTALDDAPIITA